MRSPRPQGKSSVGFGRGGGVERGMLRATGTTDRRLDDDHGRVAAWDLRLKCAGNRAMVWWFMELKRHPDACAHLTIDDVPFASHTSLC